MKTIFWKYTKAIALLSLSLKVIAAPGLSPSDPCIAYRMADLQRLPAEKSKKYEEGTVDHRLVNYADHGTSEVKDFLSCLQTHVLNDDVRSIAKMVHYPIQIPTLGVVKSESQFVRLYPKVFNGRVKNEVMMQQYDDLIVKDSIGLSNGLLWFSGRVLNGQRTPIKIIAINPSP